MSKPDYLLPPLDSQRSGELGPRRRVVSTFSGAGGSCLGLSWAGFETVWASEFVDMARVVYELNHPRVPVDPRDIREVEPEEILDVIGLDAGELDLLEGSPPCASFSTAGDRERGWGEERRYSERRQRTDDLFSEFARLLRGLRPRLFVAENVRGLVQGVSRGHFKEIIRELRAAGYVVETRLLDAQWLGVPQNRKRLFFVGVRGDLGLSPAFPEPLPYRFNVRDVLDVYELVHDTSGNAYRTPPRFGNRPAPTITVAGNAAMAWQLKAIDEPGARPRKLTIEELKLLCGFPESFVLAGSYTQQWERLARAVPPPMMMRIGEHLLDILDRADDPYPVDADREAWEQVAHE
jgi:DNA (cytosine-5)-methyltransferase 1